MQNAWLDEAQAGIKTAGRNINNLRYADDTTIMAESEEMAASTEGIFRIIQSIPSPKAEPFKRWMAKVSEIQLQHQSFQ